MPLLPHRNAPIRKLRTNPGMGFANRMARGRRRIAIVKTRTTDGADERPVSLDIAPRVRSSRDPLNDWMRERVARLERRIASLKRTNQALEGSPFLKAMNERVVTDMDAKLVLFRLQQERCEREAKRRSIVAKQTNA